MAKKEKEKPTQNRTDNNGMNLNKISFWTLTILCLLMLTSWLLGFFGLSFYGKSVVDAIIQLMMLAIIIIHAWRYVRKRDAAWKILFLFIILILLCFIILPVAYPGAWFSKRG